MRYLGNRSRAASAILLVVCSLASCSSSDKANPLSPEPVPLPVPLPKPVVPDSTVLTRPARSLAVSVALDQARSVRAHITTDGGTVSATGADGTRYTLTIPKDGLLEAQDITLTPVSSVGGRALGTDGPRLRCSSSPRGCAS